MTDEKFDMAKLPNYLTYARIAAALGVAPSELLAEAEAKNKVWRSLPQPTPNTK